MRLNAPMELLRAVVGIRGGKERGNNQQSRVACLIYVYVIKYSYRLLALASPSQHSFFSFPLDVSFTHRGVILSHNDVIFIVCCFMIRVSCRLRGRGGWDLLCTRCLCLLTGGF